MPADLRKRLLFVLLFAGFGYGIFMIFSIRFKVGDIYPPYSSFRSDPLGCRAFHDALVHTGEVTVQRNVTPLHLLKPMEDTTILVPGMGFYDLASVPRPWFESLDRLVRGGARLVLCYAPSRVEERPVENMPKPSGSKPADTKTPVKPGKGGSKKANAAPPKTPDRENPVKKGGDKEEPDREPVFLVDMAVAWGFGQGYGEKMDGKAEPVRGYGKKRGLGRQDWHSSLVFTDLAPSWKPVYTMNGKAVIMERSLGRGSVVVAGDSYFLSNESLRNAPNPRLLAFLAGRNKTVVFDESHFGIRSEPGIAGLIRQFGLHGAAFAVLLFCLLYIWKNAGYFVPPREEEEVRDVWARDQAAGLASLFKRHIRSADLLSVCVDEWEKTAPPDRRALLTGDEKRTILHKLVRGDGGKPPDPVAGYREIKRLLSEREL